MTSLTSDNPWGDHPSNHAHKLAVLALDLPADHPVRRILGAGDIPATLIVEVLDTVSDDADVYAARHTEFVNQAGIDLWASALREAIGIVSATLAAALTGGAR